MQTVTIPPTAIRPEVIDHIRKVGRVADLYGQQVKIYSVEGPDFYAFGSKIPGDNSITIDFDMARGWRPDVYAFVLPMGCEIGDGYGREVPLSWLTLGVVLDKRGSSAW